MEIKKKREKEEEKERHLNRVLIRPHSISLVYAVSLRCCRPQPLQERCCGGGWAGINNKSRGGSRRTCFLDRRARRVEGRGGGGGGERKGKENEEVERSKKDGGREGAKTDGGLGGGETEAMRYTH